MAQVIDHVRVGKKGFPRHWQLLGYDAPLKEVPDSEAPAGPPIVSGPPTKNQLLAYAANARWKLEQAGVDWNGHRAHTDRESRANYVGLCMAVQLGVREDGGIYKFADGPAPLANTDVVPLSLAVARYVQALFTREAEIAEQVEAGTITTMAEIDKAFAS